MQYEGIRRKNVITAVIRTMLMVSLFTAVFLIACFSTPNTLIAFAAEESALSVYLDGKLEGSFTVEDLEKLSSVVNDYSAWDDKPEFSLEEGIRGTSVEDILVAAEIMDDVSLDGTIRFSNSSGDSVCLTGRQLFEEARYCYPEGAAVNHSDGIIPEKASDNAEAVKAIISTDSETGCGLYIGQAAPNEENKELFIKGVADGGSIEVSTKKAEQCKAIDTDPLKGTTWRPGKKIVLTSQGQESFERDKERIYYTLDLTMSPGYGCPIYNYSSGSEDTSNPVFPKLPEGTPKERSFIYLKTIVKAYGKLDSKPQGFTFYVGDALTVKLDGATVAAYEPDEFSSFPVIEESLSYSGYNSYPSPHTVSTERSYDVSGIIKNATKKDISEYNEDTRIRFTAWDGYYTELTFGQLFGTKRYYYPNFIAGTDDRGSAALPEAYEGKTEVPVVIDAEGKNTLLFGQVAPNEQNHSEFVSNMFTMGEIEIITADPDQCSPVVPENYYDGETIAAGTEIRFPFPDEDHKRDKLYYILDPADGEIPGEGCAFYYYSANSWPKEQVNAPVFNEIGVHTIAAKVVAYGKMDSEVYSLRYLVSPETPAGVAAKPASYSKITVSWEKQADISGYKIYRSTGSASPELIKTVSPDTVSFTDSGLKTGTMYFYQLASYATSGDGTIIESELSEKVSAKPVLSNPTIKLTAGKSKAVVKWSKVSGASGYQIYRSLKKTTGYKRVKTVTSGKTVSFTNKKLKKGKYYYYKVRAYRTVNGKKVYSSFSSIKRVKAK